MPEKRITLYSAEVCFSRTFRAATISETMQESVYAHVVTLALEEANLLYDIIDIDLNKKPDWYKGKVYPTTKAPP